MTTIHSYLDPGSGSALAQLAAAGLAALGVAVKTFLGRLGSWRHRRDDDDEAANTEGDPQ